MFPQLIGSRFRCIALPAILLPLLPLNILMAQSRTRANAQAQQSGISTPKNILDLGLYYYNNDDLSGKAEQSFKQLLAKKYDGTEQAETAQYYLAAYYQRKFYIQRVKRHVDDWNTLKQSATEYRNYTNKYYWGGRHTWLCDAFFNLAMVNLQLGETGNALNELSKIKEASSRDGTIYVYQVVWSSQSQDVVDSNLSALRLADCARQAALNNPKYFERAVSVIRQWAQGQKLKAF
jgi:hypothetical protein